MCVVKREKNLRAGRLPQHDTFNYLQFQIMSLLFQLPDVWGFNANNKSLLFCRLLPNEITPYIKHQRAGFKQSCCGLETELKVWRNHENHETISHLESPRALDFFNKALFSLSKYMTDRAKSN